MIRQIVKKQAPWLILKESLGWIAMKIEIPQIAEDLRYALSSLLNGPFV